MTDIAASPGTRVPLWRRLVFHPVTWGALLLALAIIATLAGDDLSFFPFLLMLIGGWCFGFAFVNATMRMAPRSGLILHVGVAVALGAIIAVVVESGGDLLETLPERARAVAVVLQMAAIPAAGWIWLGVFARVGDAFTRHETKKRPAPEPPEWEREESGDGSSVRFRAIPLRMRIVTVAIIVIVIVFGLLGTVLLIAFDDVVMRLGPRLMIILVGVLIALPVYSAFTAVLRRRTVDCVVAFGNDEIRVSAGNRHRTIPLRDLELLVWRTRSDYARVEVRGAGVDLSLITGLATPPARRTAELPVLPRRVFRRLELAGMTEVHSRRDDVTRFARLPPT